MTQDEFEFLVNTLELDASIRPRRYKAKLAALAVLGYMYVIGIVAVLMGLLGAMVALIVMKSSLAWALGKVVIALVVLIFIVLRAMWVKLEPPQGRRATAKEFPELFESIEQVRRLAVAPRVHEVLITSDFNAAVVQHPRLGFFGWHKNFLILGLPLLQALQLDEFKAVLAHEFGHLSGAHGRFGAWIYRLRAGWFRLGHALREQEHWGSALFAKFFAWYLPKFNAYSFVQARQQEYEADAISAQVASPQVAGSALVRVSTQASFLDEKFWPALFKRTHDAPEPAVAPYTLMDHALRRPLPPEHAKRFIDDSLRRRTGYDDTHPCLADRLKNLEVKPNPAPLLGPTAAQALLGSRAVDLRVEFDEKWKLDVKAWWTERHQSLSKGKARFVELSARVESLAVDERFEHAQLAEEFAAEERARQLYVELLALEPKHLGARFANGRILLRRNDAAGIAEIEATMSQDAAAVEPGCELIVAYYRRQGQDSRCKPFLERFWQKQEEARAAESERRRFAPDEAYLRHDLPAAAVDDLIAQLNRFESLGEAYLVRKKVRLLPDQPCYALFVLADVATWKLSSDPGGALVGELSAKLRVDFDLRIIALNGDGKQYSKAVKKIVGARIFGG